MVGHEDWVTCLASKHDKDGGLVLATGSQDSFVRLWRVERRKEEEEKEAEEELAVTEQVVKFSHQVISPSYYQVVKLGEEEWLVVVESVLAGFYYFFCSGHKVASEVEILKMICFQVMKGEFTLWHGVKMGSCSLQAWTGEVQ